MQVQAAGFRWAESEELQLSRGAVVRRAILDKNVVVGPGEMVGVDLEKDRERFAISAGGVVAVGKAG